MATKKTPKSSEKLNFEAISEKLEELTSQLENSDAMSLEASLEAFETGIKLTREAQQILSAAEQKVQMLVEKNGEINLQLQLMDANVSDSDSMQMNSKQLF